MIVPMKKVTLITLQNECESALHALRDLGVMQIESGEHFSDDSVAAAERVNGLKRVLSLLEQVAADINFRNQKTGIVIQHPKSLRRSI